MANQEQLKTGITFCFLFFTAYSIYSIFFGHIAMEEAAYIYAAKLVSLGKMPYTDFFYPQAPLLPYLYAPFVAIFGAHLIPARFVSFLFSILIFVLIYKITKGKGGGLATLLALTLFISNVFTLTRYTSVLVYAAASFFIVFSIFFASRKLSKENIFLSLIMMTAAVATRISILPAFIVLLIYFLLRGFRPLSRGFAAKAAKPRFSRSSRIVFILLAAVFSIIVFFLPFIIKSFDHFYFDTITYQVNTTKYYDIFEGISILRWNLRKSLLLAGLVENFFSGIILGGAAIIYLLWLALKNKKNLKRFTAKNHFELLLILIILVLFGTHLLPDRPYTVYFTILTPPLAILFGLIGNRIFAKIENQGIKRGFIALFAVIIILSPILVSERTILNVNPFKTVKEINDFIQKNTMPGSKVLTLSVMPAMEAERELLPKTERGNYLYFPTLDKKIVQKYGLLDAETLISYVNKKEPAAIALTTRYFFQKRVTGRGEEFQEIKKTLLENYFEALRLENYAGNWGRIYIYLPK